MEIHPIPTTKEEHRLQLCQRLVLQAMYDYERDMKPSEIRMAASAFFAPEEIEEAFTRVTSYDIPMRENPSPREG